VYFSSPFAPEVRKGNCPNHIIEESVSSGRDIVKIVWDEDDTPDHCKGNTQWSVRPYRIQDTCDGTRDGNTYLVCREFCKKTGLDLKKIYTQAYPDDIFTDLDLQHYDEFMKETEIPEKVTSENIRYLLNSLYSMNHRSLTQVLAERWEEMGYDIDEFWNT
jgi:hypothetical protein